MKYNKNNKSQHAAWVGLVVVSLKLRRDQDFKKINTLLEYQKVKVQYQNININTIRITNDSKQHGWVW